MKRISNQTAPLEERFGADQAVLLNCEAGFEAIDYTMCRLTQPIFTAEGKNMIRSMRSLADAHGVCFNQTHSPCPSYRFGDENYNRAVKSAILRAIEITAELGATVTVIHPIWCPEYDADGQYAFNLAWYADAMKAAQDAGVTVAVENMWGRHRDCPDKILPNVCSTGAELARYIDGFREAYPKTKITACLDIGHSGLVGETADGAAAVLGHDRLGAIHLHDNDFYHDLHTLPFLQSIRYDELAKVFAKIGYSGDFTLETHGFLERIPDGLIPAALRYAKETVSYFRDSVAAYTGVKESKK